MYHLWNILMKVDSGTFYTSGRQNKEIKSGENDEKENDWLAHNDCIIRL